MTRFAIVLSALSVALPLAGASADDRGWQAMRAKSAVTWPDCYCTDRQGKRHELGDVICLSVDGRTFQAKCAMSQNSPIWRDQKHGCPSASLGSRPSSTPPMTPLPTG